MATNKKRVIEKFNSVVASTTTRDKLVLTEIDHYMNKNAKFLATRGFSRDRIIFPKDVENRLRELYLGEMSEREYWKWIDTLSPIIDKSMRVVSNPINLGLAVSYAHSLNTKKKPEEKYVAMMFLREYTSKMYKYFPYGVDPDLMNYIIEKKASNSYLFKKYSNVSDVLAHKMDTVISLWESRLKDPTDVNIKEFISTISTRINLGIKEMKALFETSKNESTAQILGSKSGYNNEDFDELENNTVKIANLKKNISTIVYTEKYKPNLVGTNTDAIRNIFEEDNDLVLFTVESMIEEFLVRTPGVSLDGFNKGFIKFTLSSRRYSDDIKKAKVNLSKWYRHKYRTSKLEADTFTSDMYRYLAIYIWSIGQQGGV